MLEILYSTKESEKLYSPIESYILSVESKNIAYSIAHGTHKLTLTQNRLFVNEIDYDLTDDGSELFVDGDLATHQIMMFTIAGLESHKDNSDVEYANSTFSVAYDNSKIVFGRIEISGGDIKFNKYENTLAIDELMSTEFANVSTPSEFYAKIKKITFVKCNILDYFYNTDYTMRMLKILKILQRIIILFLYYMIMILETEFDNALEVRVFDSLVNEFGSSNLLKSGSTINVSTLSELTYSSKIDDDLFDYFFIEDSLLSQNNLNSRAKVLGYDINYVVVTDECNFEPPTPTPTRTTSYTPTPSPTETPTPSCDLTFPHDMDTESVICDLNDYFKLEFTFEGYSKSPSLGGRAIYKASNKYREKVVYYNHDLNRWIYESKILTGVQLIKYNYM